jgi:hypothetical protein
LKQRLNKAKQMKQSSRNDETKMNIEMNETELNGKTKQNNEA